MIMKSRKFGLKVRSVVDEMGQKDFEAAREELKKKHQKAEARATPKGYDCPTRLFRYQCGFKTLDPVERDRDAHIRACYAAIRNGTPPAAGITIGASAALTAILGREAIYQKKVMEWTDLGVEL